MLILAVTLLATGCVPDLTPRPTPTPRRYTGDTGPPLTPASGVPGDPTAGRRLFVSTGCAGCHTLRGVPTATGVAGPNLTNVALRPTLAGETIPMAPETLTAFLLEPAAVKPGTPMPNVGLTPEQAADITAFLYSQPYRPGP